MSEMIEIPREILEKQILHTIGGKQVFVTMGNNHSLIQCAKCLYVLATDASEKYQDGVRKITFDPRCGCEEDHGKKS